MPFCRWCWKNKYYFSVLIFLCLASQRESKIYFPELSPNPEVRRCRISYFGKAPQNLFDCFGTWICGSRLRGLHSFFTSDGGLFPSHFCKMQDIISAKLNASSISS